MRKHYSRFSLFFLLFGTGCSDSPQSIFRSALNGKNEVIDSLMKVCDEGGAVEFNEKVAKDYMAHLKACKDKLDKWAFNRDWTWITMDSKENTREEILKKVKKDSRAAVESALDATQQYLEQEEKNLSRIRHEVKRLEKTLAMLQESKPGDYRTLAMLTQELYYTRMVIAQKGGAAGGGGGGGATKGGAPGRGPGGKG
ncbi:MAG: hypothetical protein HY040_02160 [Planctomycetes bacterium]|nr:hypothetical protein [Planctomycetota bacterium]